MKKNEMMIAKKDKLLSDCVVFERKGWSSSYQLHLTDDFKHISQLDGHNLRKALKAYRRHPDTILDRNPAWILENSCVTGFIICASSLGYCIEHLTLTNAPFLLFFNISLFLCTQKLTQKSLSFLALWLRGEATLILWNNKFSITNQKFALLESLSSIQKNPIIIELFPLYNLLEEVKRMIASRMPEQQLKDIKEIKSFEEKVKRLAKDQTHLSSPEDRPRRQSWCEWLSLGFLFRNRRLQHPAVTQEVPAASDNKGNSMA